VGEFGRPSNTKQLCCDNPYISKTNWIHWRFTAIHQRHSQTDKQTGRQTHTHATHVASRTVTYHDRLKCKTPPDRQCNNGTRAIFAAASYPLLEENVLFH